MGEVLAHSARGREVKTRKNCCTAGSFDFRTFISLVRSRTRTHTRPPCLTPLSHSFLWAQLPISLLPLRFAPRIQSPSPRPFLRLHPYLSFPWCSFSLSRFFHSTVSPSRSRYSRQITRKSYRASFDAEPLREQSSFHPSGSIVSFSSSHYATSRASTLHGFLRISPPGWKHRQGALSCFFLYLLPLFFILSRSNPTLLLRLVLLFFSLFSLTVASDFYTYLRTILPHIYYLFIFHFSIILQRSSRPSPCHVVRYPTAG